MVFKQNKRNELKVEAKKIHMTKDQILLSRVLEIWLRLGQTKKKSSPTWRQEEKESNPAWRQKETGQDTT